jgi:hypothetical protein
MNPPGSDTKKWRGGGVRFGSVRCGQRSDASKGKSGTVEIGALKTNVDPSVSVRDHLDGHLYRARRHSRVTAARRSHAEMAITAASALDRSRRPRLTIHAGDAARRRVGRAARTVRIVHVRVLDDPVGATVGGRSAPHRPARGPASQAARTD